MQKSKPFFLSRVQMRICYGPSGWQGYLAALIIEGLFFFVSFQLENESEALFAVIYLTSAVAVALFGGRGAGVLAGILAALSVDYHYIRPRGVILETPAADAFFLLTLLLIQLVLIGIRILQRSVEAARSESQAREEILSIVAHDLRQPLSSIGIRAELAEQALSSEKERERHYLRSIKKDVRRLDRMISDLLDIGNIDSKQLLVKRERLDLNALMTTTIENFRLNHPASPIRLEISLRSCVWADSDRFQQVLENLLSNAVKYGDPNAEIKVSVIERPDFAEISVINSGDGISKDQLPTIFERYKRTRSARLSQASGLGLGLYITKELVEAQGGRIWAESQMGETTTFHFIVPK